MNFCSRVKENIWVGAGSAAGLAIGVGANLLRSGSLFAKSFSACSNPFNGFTPFAAINGIRQKAISSTSLFHPHVPLIHTVPMLASSLWNTFNPTPSEKDKSLAARGWQNLSNQVINPLVHQNLLLGGSLLARHFLSSPSVYPSGYVIFHAANTLNAIKSLEGLSQTESTTQKKIYSIINIGIALTDAVWLYNSAANCHSVAEIASGIACVAIGLFGLEAGKVIVNKGYNLIKNRFFSITETKEEVKQITKEVTPISQDNKCLQEFEKIENEKVLQEPKSPLPQLPEAEQLSKTTSETHSTISKIKIASSFLKEHAWIAAGSLIGLALGGANNMIKTGSILGRDKDTCRNNPFGSFHLLTKINDFREDQLGITRQGIPLTLINPLFPLIYLVPMFTYAAWNTVTKKNSSENSAKKIAGRGWKHISKDVIVPGIYSTLLSIGGLVAREYVFEHSNKQALDTSGHVILQIAQNLCAMKALQALDETGTSLQKKTFIMLNAALAVTDGIWMYNTAANCHSVADVVAGLACSVIAYVGIESVKIILSIGYDWSKLKLIKYLKKGPQVAEAQK